jgi:hypothetical protein
MRGLFLKLFFLREEILSDADARGFERQESIVDIKIGQFILSGQFFKLFNQLGIGSTYSKSYLCI